MGKTKREKKKGRTPGPATSKSRSPASEASARKKLEKVHASNKVDKETKEETSQVEVPRTGSLPRSEKVARERGRPRSQHRLVEAAADNSPRRIRASSRERERSRRRDYSNTSRREHRRQLGSLSHSRDRRRSPDSRRRNNERRSVQVNHSADWESLARRRSRYEPGRRGPGERRSPRPAWDNYGR